MNFFRPRSLARPLFVALVLCGCNDAPPDDSGGDSAASSTDTGENSTGSGGGEASTSEASAGSEGDGDADGSGTGEGDGDGDGDTTGTPMGCEETGGALTTGTCCQSVGDLPNTCVTGGCSCAPEYSHEVVLCQCPLGMCFDGSSCVEDAGKA